MTHPGIGPLLAVGLAALLGACQPIGSAATSSTDGIHNARAGWQPTIADETLARDVAAYVLMLDSGKMPECDSRRIVETAFLPGGDPATGWQELWQVGGCGTARGYLIGFTPSPRGGTDFAISANAGDDGGPWRAAPPIPSQ